MYGKIFGSLFTGSRVGKGALHFALMSYVIAHAQPAKDKGGTVELNPKLLATIIGEPQEEIEREIDGLCQPDLDSRSPKEEGKTLIKVGRYEYSVVNFDLYQGIKNREDRREQNRVSQAVFRSKAGKRSPQKQSVKIKIKPQPVQSDESALTPEDQAFFEPDPNRPDWVNEAAEDERADKAEHGGYEVGLADINSMVDHGRIIPKGTQ